MFGLKIILIFHGRDLFGPTVGSSNCFSKLSLKLAKYKTK